MDMGEKRRAPILMPTDLTTARRFSELFQYVATLDHNGLEKKPDSTGVLTQNRPQTRVNA
jgi:hypothetical protein